MKYILKTILLLTFSIAFSQSKSIDLRVEELLKKMTLEEKIGQLNQYTDDWNITGPLYYVILNDSELDNKKTKLLNIFINYVLDKSGINYDKKLSLNKKFDIIDKLTYINKKNNKINLDKARLINSIIYKLFIFLYTNNNYTFLFPKEFYKIFINKDLFGIYKLKTIMFYNINHKNIILEKDKFNNDEYNKLYIFAKKYTHNLLV